MTHSKRRDIHQFGTGVHLPTQDDEAHRLGYRDAVAMQAATDLALLRAEHELVDDDGNTITDLDDETLARAIVESLNTPEAEGWIRLADGRRCYARRV